MSKLDPPVELTDPERQCHVDYIQNHVAQRSEFSAEFFEHAKALWQDEGVKECFLRSNEYGSIDFAKYFLDRVDIAKQVDYVPTVQDYFRCKSLYASRPDPDFLIMEWPSQCHVHKYLRLAMLDIHMCIFVIDCSNFNEYEPGFEDEPILKETLFVLKSLLALSCRYCEQAAFLIFLNKQDQLATKLLSGRWKLEDYFPEFVHYSTPHDASSEPGEDPMVTRAKYFIRDLCLEILKGINKDEEKFFVQFTSATDTDNMSQVFKNCTSFLKRHRILL